MKLNHSIQKYKIISGILASVVLLFILFHYLKFKKIDRIDSQPVIVIATFSDFHGQLEPTYEFKKDKTLKEMGGISRLATVLNTIKKQYPNKVLLFGSGDYFTEDFREGKYLDAFGGKIFAYFFNALPIDASTIGNHEFDFGVETGYKTLHDFTFPIIATNLKQSDSSHQILKKLIINKNGYKIGILGIMLPEIKGYGDSTKKEMESIQFESDFSEFQTAVNDLRNLDHVDFIIVLSHIGIDGDKLLANEINGIDVICGGHSHTVMKKSAEFVVNKPKNQKTVITHPGYKGKYLGVIKLWPKENSLLKYEWDLIKIDSSIAKDLQFEEKLQQFKIQLPSSSVITKSTDPIDTTKQGLRNQENSFANFVTDVIREHFLADIVLINASSFRGNKIFAPREITEADLDKLFPFKDNFLIRLKVLGKDIKQALELGVAELPEEARNLLHVSGLKYTVNFSNQATETQKDSTCRITGIKQDGKRVVNIDVLQKNNSFAPLKLDQEYDVIINTMMIDPKFYGAFFIFKSIENSKSTGLTEKEILIKYFKNHKTISPNTVGRLIIEKH